MASRPKGSKKSHKKGVKNTSKKKKGMFLAAANDYDTANGTIESRGASKLSRNECTVTMELEYDLSERVPHIATEITRKISGETSVNAAAVDNGPLENVLTSITLQSKDT